jgi:hypothetical protein
VGYNKKENKGKSSQIAKPDIETTQFQIGDNVHGLG